VADRQRDDVLVLPQQRGGELVAQAEATGVNEILSFDRTVDRIDSISRREP